MLSGTINLQTADVMVALVSGSYVPNTAHTVYGDVSAHQVTDPLFGYITGGKALQSKTITQDGVYAKFDAADTSWTTTTITNASGAVIYISGATSNTRYLVSYVDLGLSSTTNGTFTIVWNSSNGIFRISGA